MNHYYKVEDIRQHFVDELESENFTIDRNGSKTIEMIGASFIADEDCIFGTLNRSYINAEIHWYNSQSLNINDIYGPDREPPKAWKLTADHRGEINSNYGKLIYANGHWNQYESCLKTLIDNPDSRRASMIYNRPSIHFECTWNGRNDFICTNAVTYYVRDNKLEVVVQMRSNDAWAGYRNDLAWQKHVQEKLLSDFNEATNSNVELGSINWQVMNLHVYQRNFYLIDAYVKGHNSLSKSEYRVMFPDSPYCE